MLISILVRNDASITSMRLLPSQRVTLRFWYLDLKKSVSQLGKYMLVVKNILTFSLFPEHMSKCDFYLFI